MGWLIVVGGVVFLALVAAALMMQVATELQRLLP